MWIWLFEYKFDHLLLFEEKNSKNLKTNKFNTSSNYKYHLRSKNPKKFKTSSLFYVSYFNFL
jgi:hypothetical protein